MIQVCSEQRVYRVQANRLKALLEFVLRKECSSIRQLTVLVTDDRRMRKYHERFFKDASTTDVISVGMPKRVPRTERGYLGDVIVNAAMAIRASKTYRTTVRNEFERYAVHGLLHLLGYRDKRKQDHRRMHAMQEKYLKDFDENV